VLLFTANVTAILTTGVIVMSLYRVHRLAEQEGALPVNRRNAVLVIAALVVVVGGTLTRTSLQIARDTIRENRVRDAVEDWADSGNWEILDVSTRRGMVIVRAEGAPPAPLTFGLLGALREAGVEPTDVELDLVPRDTVRLGIER
jgi:hypothetical protein